MGEAKRILKGLTGYDTDYLIDQGITLPMDIILKAMLQIASNAYSAGESGEYKSFLDLLHRKWD